MEAENPDASPVYWESQPPEDERLSPKDVKKVEAMMVEAGKCLSHPLSLKLARKACVQFLAYQDRLHLKITIVEAREQIYSLYHQTNSLMDCLDKLDGSIKRDLERAVWDCFEFYKHSQGGISLADWKDMLSGLIQVIGTYAEWLDINPGGHRPRPATISRNALIRTLATAFEKEKLIPALDAVRSDTEHDNQKGEFYDMLWGCLAVAGFPPETGIDLENAIRMKLKGRLPRTTPWPA